MADQVRNAKDLPDKLLAWLWAYQQQIKLLDDHDALLLRCARNSGWTDGHRRLFLKKYGLERGPSGRAIRQNSKEIWATLESIFKPLATKKCKVAELQEYWEQATREVEGIIHFKCRSFTAKLMWFYQPKRMTMFDQNALKSLARWQSRHDPTGPRADQHFLLAFDKFYNENESNIRAVEQFSDRKCPYLKRVGDQWLWLEGGSDKDKKYTLESFRLSLKLTRSIKK